MKESNDDTKKISTNEGSINVHIFKWKEMLLSSPVTHVFNETRCI